MTVKTCVCSLLHFKKTVKKSMCRPHNNGGGDKRKDLYTIGPKKNVRPLETGPG